MKTLILIITLYLLSFFSVAAQNKSEATNTPYQWSILFGLNQPIVFKGFNAEVNYKTEKWIFDYSHGFNLHVDGSTLDNEYEHQKINFKITNSLGFGVGYRFTKAFNVRFEPKVHFYETYYDGQQETKSNSIANFTTYTLGIGAYYHWQPFENKNSFLKGITIVPSVRYWYQVDSTLDHNEFTYFNTQTNKTETFKAPNIGLANTPLVLNVSVGYSF